VKLGTGGRFDGCVTVMLVEIRSTPIWSWTSMGRTRTL
jgi:hypothetical protein